jgi:phage shock protein PspC (stress-responsive transcriptional regulator)
MDSSRPYRKTRHMKETEGTQLTDSPAPGPAGGRRRLTRSRDDRYIGGVAAGLARYFNVDPALVRVAFAVSLAVGGAGVLAYLILLVVVPVEGDPDAPVPPVTGGRRKVAIGGTVAVGVALLAASASGGSGTTWLFGFGPGVLFGLLLWTAVVVALVWAARRAGTGAGAGAGADATTSEAGFAPSPSQIPPAAASAASGPEGPGAEQGGTRIPPESRPDTQVLPGGRAAPTGPGGPSGPPKARSGTPATLGRVMTWVAIGLAGLVVLSILALISFGLTALFGAIPVAILVIGCGVAVVWLALADRPQLALWATAAAIAIAIPMATVSIASLDIEGEWGDVQKNPATAAAIPADGYKMAVGALKVDLRGFPFREGETVVLPTRSGFGATSVIVPDEVCVIGEVEGRAGYIYNRGSDWSGVDVRSALPQAAPDVPVLRLGSEFRIGYFGIFDDTGWNATDEDWPEDLEGKDRAADERRATAACQGRPERERPARPERARAQAGTSGQVGPAGQAGLSGPLAQGRPADG